MTETTRQIAVATTNGKTVIYNITDYDPNNGLSLDDMQQVIENLHSTTAYNNRIANDLGSSGGTDNIVNVDIDNPAREQTQAWYDGGSEGNGGVNIKSSDFTDGQTYSEKGTGESVQKDVDTAFVHEVAHLHDERINDSDMNVDLADREDYGRDVANDVRRELGLPEREDWNRAADQNVQATEDMDGDGDIDADDNELAQNQADQDAETTAETSRVAQDLTETTYTKDVDQDNASGRPNTIPDERYNDPSSRGEVATTASYNDEVNRVVDWVMDQVFGTEDSGGWRKTISDAVEDVASGGTYTPSPVFGYVPHILDLVAGVRDAAGSSINTAGAAVAAGTKSLGQAFADAVAAVQAAADAAVQTLADLGAAALQSLGLADWFVEFWEASGAAEAMGSPLVLDLDGDGIELVSLENSSIFWDIDEDGFSEKTGWAAADDGFLAIDLDGDGLVSNHTELFGSMTEDGFTALSVYDTNSDGVVDSSDTQFDELLVWQDNDQDGISEAVELYSLADLDIVSIDLNAATPYEMYIEGHHITHTSTYTIDDGVSGPQTLEIVDAWFEHDNRNTEYIDNYTLDLTALVTATIRGYGTLPDLHVAASIDNDVSDPSSLTNKLIDFQQHTLVDLFSDARTIMDETRDIMLRWASADVVDPTSMGQWADAQELTFINALRGEQWLLFGNDPNPWSASAQGLQKAFEIAHYAITARLIAQAAGAALFNDEVFYNPISDTFEGFTALNQDALDALVAKSLDGTQVQNKTEFWVQVVNMVDNSVGITNLDTTQYNVLEATIQASDSTLTIVDLQDKIAKNIEDQLSWTPDGDYILGTSGADTYDGTIGDDFYSGGGGADILSGGLGNDQLRGDADNDTLDGQLGDDVVWGGHGDDTYLFFLGHGDDTLSDTSGNDKILFGAGITANDLSFIREGAYNLTVEIDPTVGYGSITIQNQMSAALVETLEFDDGSTLDMTVLDHTYIGTDGNETIYGVRTGFGGSGVDTIYGEGGDDVIYGYSITGGASTTVQNILYGGDGNDTFFAENGGDYLNGEAGNDAVNGGIGIDTLVGGTGDDTLKGKAGDDVYEFNYGDGNDLIEESSGTDKILFGSGITAAMLDITRLNINDVLIEIDGGLGGSIELNWQTYGTGYIVETLEFDDGSTIDMTALDFTLNGTSAGETLYGVRFGGSGVDTIYGHEGNDVIYGYRVVADTEDNFLYGGSGNDTVYGAHGVDLIYGDDGDDTIRGYNGNDTIYGGNGADTLQGGNQDDVLYGEDGNDFLFGENNNDILIGGLGLDELTGGGGNDTFTFLAASSFDAVDVIKDFSSTYDAIDISDILSAYDPLTDAITDFVQITDDGTDSTLYVDTDGGADNFVAIALIDNRTGLTDEEALETSGNLIAA